MIDLHYWPTPNGHKITIFLEETATPYRIVPVNIGAGDQFRPEFLAISPNNRMPAIVDHAPWEGRVGLPGSNGSGCGGDPSGASRAVPANGPAANESRRGPPDGQGPLSVFESGAILVYLAEKTGRFLPADLRGRFDTLQWLFWQIGGLGPMAGQNHHFSHYAPEKLPYAIDRYVRETSRLYAVLDRRLADRAFVAGAYSIADMAAYPWIVSHQRQQQNLADFPHLKRWFEAIGARPAVVRAYEKGKAISSRPVVDETSRAILFGQSAQTVTSPPLPRAPGARRDPGNGT
jgi:GST-like protein